MFSKFAVAASVASLAAALPQTVPPNPNPPTAIQLIALKSGDPNVHQVNIHAYDFGLWLNKDTASSCPSGTVDCSSFPGNQTVISASSTETTAFMNVEVPGGQQLYTGPDGSIGYTTAHSQNIPEGAITDYFEYDAPKAEGGVGYFTGSGTWYACPTEGDGPGKPYKLTALRNHGSHTANCTFIQVGAVPVSSTPNAWQYD